MSQSCRTARCRDFTLLITHFWAAARALRREATKDRSGARRLITWRTWISAMLVLLPSRRYSVRKAASGSSRAAFRAGR